MPPTQDVFSQVPSIPTTALKTFHSFPLLPPELRLKIFHYTLPTHRFVNIKWSPRTRSFVPFGHNQNPPMTLHINRESRALALKTYTLSFSSTPEFAKVYFSPTYDALYIDWASLGPSPGRLGRKMSDQDCERVRSLLINESFVLGHANEKCRELARFKNLSTIAVICDADDPDSGGQYGDEEMAEFAEEADEGLEEGDLSGRTERWPELVCLRSGHDYSGDGDEEGEEGEEGGECSRHWWFEGWNERAMVKQKKAWPESLASCLLATMEDDDEGDQFWLEMLFMHAMASSAALNS